MYTRSWTITRDVPRPGLSEVVVSVTWNNPEPREITAITYLGQQTVETHPVVV